MGESSLCELRKTWKHHAQAQRNVLMLFHLKWAGSILRNFSYYIRREKMANLCVKSATMGRKNLATWSLREGVKSQLERSVKISSTHSGPYKKITSPKIRNSHKIDSRETLKLGVFIRKLGSKGIHCSLEVKGERIQVALHTRASVPITLSK